MGNSQWNVGLVTTNRIGAPFSRVKPSALVNFNNGSAENPIVTFLPSFGVYLAVFDDLVNELHGFGMSTSRDLLRWSPRTRVPVPGGARTPLAVIPEDDGTVSIFLTKGMFFSR